MLVVKLPPETKNTKLSFAHFTGITAKISVQQNNVHTIYSLNFDTYLCVTLLSGGFW
jgi:hypothetical protein